ncbi:MAG TPA: ROK family transcriptional regulator [Firmicutes bacterium]|nr:ROK family transcriptional regulator [Bacillota bacterium]
MKYDTIHSRKIKVIVLENLRRGNKALIKDINRALVLDQLRSYGPLSRTDIAKRTKLGLSTLTKITDDLIAQGMIKEIGEGDSSGGRRPVYLEFNSNYGYALGVKIEERRIILALTNLQAEVLEKSYIDYSPGAPADEVIGALIQGISKMMDKNKFLVHRWLGIGIAVSGLVDKNSGCLIFSTLLGWGEVPFRRILQGKFPVPIIVDNDVNAYALAELAYGYGREVGNFILATIGVGIGAGLVLDGKIFRGEFGGAGEIGHMVIYGKGNSCYCGRRGCLEAHTGEKFIVNETKRLLTQEKDSILYGERSTLTFARVLKAAEDGDCCARQAFWTAGYNLGIGLVNLINIMNPATIILAGESMSGQEFLLCGIRELLQTNFFTKYQEKFDLRVSALGDDAWERGAAILVINEHFREPIYRGQRTVYSM